MPKATTITPSDGSGAFDIVSEAVTYVVAEGSGARITYDRNSHQVKQSVIVDETPAALNTALANLVEITVDGNAIKLNADKIIDYVTDGSTGSLLNYNENGHSGRVQFAAAEAPSAIEALIDAL